MKGNCHNSRISDDIDMKLGPVTKLDKRNKTTSKKFGDDVMSKTVTPLPFSPISVNLEQSESRILDA